MLYITGYKVITFKNPYLGNSCVPFQHWACSLECAKALEVPARMEQIAAAKRLDEQYEEYVLECQKMFQSVSSTSTFCSCVSRNSADDAPESEESPTSRCVISWLSAKQLHEQYTSVRICSVSSAYTICPCIRISTDDAPELEESPTSRCVIFSLMVFRWTLHKCQKMFHSFCSTSTYMLMYHKCSETTTDDIPESLESLLSSCVIS